MALSLPVGGGLGLLLSAYAYQFWFIDGLVEFTDALEDLGVNSASLLTNVLGKGVILIMLANCFVTLYGFREKCRIRNNILGHINFCGIPCLIKFFVKSGVHVFVCASLALVLVFTVVLEGMWVVFLTIDKVCDMDDLDSVRPFDTRGDAASLSLSRSLALSLLALLSSLCHPSRPSPSSSSSSLHSPARFLSPF
jgi:hypothetical protein